MTESEAPALGAPLLTGLLRTLPQLPGVYRMLGKDGDVLYVGKAKNLRRRVTAYTRPERLELRIRRMVGETAGLEVITTASEAEALLLENNLIKQLGPRYNILLKDDKSFPYILIARDTAWPQLVKHRGARSRRGEYFGPFASAAAVNQTLSHLQRAFLLRSCSDSVFAQRTRPCLLFQIKRCCAPCVGRVTPEHYAALVEQARDFLSGKSQQVQRTLAASMEEASAALEYEDAAAYRDRIRALARVQAHQDIHPGGIEEADVVAVHLAGGQACLQVFFFRSGCNFGNRAFFPAHAQDAGADEVLAAFLGQFYADKTPPREILLSHPLPEEELPLLAEALSLKAGRKVIIAVPQRGERAKVMEHALVNAREALGRRLSESQAQRHLLDLLAERLGLDRAPERIEVYDNSHIQGTNAVGGMIVAGPDGFRRNDYRKFNIRSPEIEPGDDFAMMREVLTRRFARAQKEDPDRERGQWPDLVVIDGGAGQLGVARQVFADLGVEDVALLAVSKGPDRNAGREHFHQPDRLPFMLPPNDPLLYYLQRLRDEAHRFAIGSHRTRRAKALTLSPLDEIAGIGAARKRALLHHFGSAREVGTAGLRDIEAVSGISAAMARRIYDHFHPGG